MSEKLAFELSQLDMSGCRVEFSFSPIPYGENGNEAVELLISTDPMQSPKPIAKIASGGELSRVMLAMKSILADADDADTLIFATGYHVDPTMEEMLKEAGMTYHLIGDGCKVGNIKDAISQGYTVAKDLA